MTRDDIIRMAREAGLVRTGDGWTEPHRWGMAEIEKYTALVAAHKTEIALAEAYRCGHEAGRVKEREACARVCEKTDDGTPYNLAEDCAIAIRNRGKE